MTTYKYVITANSAGRKTVALFNAQTKHADAVTRPDATVVSAGYFACDADGRNVEVLPQPSISLQIGPREGDAALIEPFTVALKGRFAWGSPRA